MSFDGGGIYGTPLLGLIPFSSFLSLKSNAQPHQRRVFVEHSHFQRGQPIGVKVPFGGAGGGEGAVTSKPEYAATVTRVVSRVLVAS